MSWLRLVAISISVVIHAAAGFLLLPSLRNSNADALNLGPGVDIALVEQGIATEGLVKLGDALQTIETAQIVPVQPASQLDEVKPDEPRDVIVSDASSVEDAVVKTQEPPTPPKPDGVHVKQRQPQQAAIATEQSSADAKTGGDAKALGLYLGQIYQRVQRAKVNAATRRYGTVVMRYTIGLDGKLLSREVVLSSGFGILDNAALAAIDRAVPFPPVPPKVSLRPLTLTQQFTFEAMLVGGRGKSAPTRRD